MKKILPLLIFTLLLSACTVPANQPVDSNSNTNSNINAPVTIDSYDDCVAAGYPIMKSNPPQCETPDGRRFTAGDATAMKTIRLYYYNPALDQDESGNVMCGRAGLVAVERRLPVSITPIQDAIRLLLKGELTSQERAQGITTEYPLEGFALIGATLRDGTLTLEFNDPNNRAVGGSCRVGILWFQIEATAKQFSEVSEVKFLPEEIFQP